MVEEKSIERLRLIAGILMVISGITHVSQIWVYPEEVTVIGASAFGVIYFIIGVLLLITPKVEILKEKLLAYWAGAILPTIGGILGILRFFLAHQNPFTVFHVIIDIIVIPICAYIIIQQRKT